MHAWSGLGEQELLQALQHAQKRPAGVKLHCSLKVEVMHVEDCLTPGDTFLECSVKISRGYSRGL
jgi:hypothetical protein